MAGPGWQSGERSVPTEGARQTVVTRGCVPLIPSHSKWGLVRASRPKGLRPSSPSPLPPASLALRPGRNFPLAFSRASMLCYRNSRLSGSLPAGYLWGPGFSEPAEQTSRAIRSWPS